MGIKQLIPHLRKTVPDLFLDTPNVATQLAKKRIAIDATILMFRFWHSLPAASTTHVQLHPSDADRQHLVQCFYNLFEYCRYINVQPILVFDYGSRPIPKQEFIHAIRNKNRDRQVQLQRSALYIHDQLNTRLTKMSSKQDDTDDPTSSPLSMNDIKDLLIPANAQNSDINIIKQDRSVNDRNSRPVPDIKADTSSKIETTGFIDWLTPNLRKLAGPLSMNDIKDLLIFTKAPNSNVIIIKEGRSINDRNSRPVPDIKADTSSKTEITGRIDWLTQILLKLPRLSAFKGLGFQQFISKEQPEPNQTSTSDSVLPPSDTPTTPTGLNANIGDNHFENLMNPRTNLHQIGKPLLALTETGKLSTNETEFATLTSIRDKMGTESLRLSRSVTGPPFGVVSTIAHLSRFLNVPVLLTPDNSEAEQVCAALVNLGEADYAVSDDSDTSIFYPEVKVIKDFFKFQKRPYLFGPISTVPARLGLADESHSALIDLCILSGCDYSSKIPLIGISRALTLLKKYKCIEEVLANRSDLKERVQNDPLWQPEKARAVFQNRFLDTGSILQSAEYAKLLVNDLSVVDNRFNYSEMIGGLVTADLTGGEILDQFQVQPFDAHTYQQLLCSFETKHG